MKSIYLLEHTVATKEVLGRIIWQGETFPLGRGKGIFSQRKCDGLSHFFYSVQQSTTCQRLADAKLSKLLVEELTGAAELSLKDFWLNAYGGKQSLLARPFLFSLLWLCIFWSVKTEQTNKHTPEVAPHLEDRCLGINDAKPTGFNHAVSPHYISQSKHFRILPSTKYHYWKWN